jgi:arginase family enzyme
LRALSKTIRPSGLVRQRHRPVPLDADPEQVAVLREGLTRLREDEFGAVGREAEAVEEALRDHGLPAAGEVDDHQLALAEFVAALGGDHRRVRGEGEVERFPPALHQ